MSEFKVKLMNLRNSMKKQSSIVMVDKSKNENSVKLSGVVATFSFTPDITAKILERYTFTVKGDIAILECNPFEFYTWIRFQLYTVEISKEDTEILLSLISFADKSSTAYEIKDKTFTIQPSEDYDKRFINVVELFNSWFDKKLKADIHFYIIDKLNPCVFYGKVKYTNDIDFLLEYSEKI